ncbi:MAG: hypothetical protein RLY86_3388 [Pseudomonadota bacterium]|jgi:uncharacterized protein (DUF2141 family)
MSRPSVPSRLLRRIRPAAVALAVLSFCVTMGAGSALAWTAPGPAAPAATGAGAGTLTVTIGNVVAGKGEVFATLCTQAEFLGRCALAAKVPAAGAEVAVRFDGVVPGDYAVMIFQDVNGDGKMGRGPFGEPSEPWAFSNNAKGRMGPPSWADSLVAVPAGALAIAVTLN